VKRIGIKQLVKIDIRKMIQQERENYINDSEESLSKCMQNSRDDEDPHADEVIRVFNYDHIDGKEFSLTTPREFQSSLEKNHVGDKTIKEHTFEENDFMHEDSSLEEIYYSRDSKSNSKNPKNSSTSAKKPSTVHHEEGVINVEGRDNHQIKVPLISLDKGKARNVCPDSENSNRGKIGSNNCISNNEKYRENTKNEYKNMKSQVKDLEIIKENHSEFSNSNSVIETFRNKRKSNISSSGNNSGDQHNVHNAQEMINEEDEEDLENEEPSFIGPDKDNKFDHSDKKEEDKCSIREYQSTDKNKFFEGSNNEDFNRLNDNKLICHV
jgi:hypothetical protein